MTIHNLLDTMWQPRYLTNCGQAVADAIVKGDGAKASALVDEIYESGLKAMEQLVEASGS